MYLKYKSLNDLISRQDVSLAGKRRALRILPFEIFAHEYLRKMNMMNVASKADETTRGTKVDLYTYFHLLSKYIGHRRLLKADQIRKENEQFARMMEKKFAEVSKRDEQRAARRTPYGMFKRFRSTKGKIAE